jgi:hypothetical protein
MLTSKDFGQHVMPQIVKDIDAYISKTDGEYKGFFTTGKLSQEYILTKQIEATAAAQMINEGANIPNMELPDGHEKKFGVREYGLKFGWTKRKVKLGGNKYIKRGVEAVKNSPRFYFNTLGNLVMEYADTAAASVPSVLNVPVVDTIGGDGLTLAHTAHTFRTDSAYTWSNKTSSFQSLTQDTLQTAINTIMQWKNNEGRVIGVKAKSLWVGQTNAATAYEILHSPGRSDTANRVDNAIQEYLPPKPKVLQTMINQNEWIIETTAENDYNLLTAWDGETETEYDKEKRTHFIYLDGCFAQGTNYPGRYFFNKQ